MTDKQTASAQELRRCAEEKLRNIDVVSSESLSSEEVKPLLHELRVHQIELEMQNEELRRMQHDLEASRADYFDLYELAPVGYLTVSEQGLIQKANLTTASMFGVVRNALLNKPFSDLVSPEDQKQYYLNRKKVFKLGEKHDLEMQMLRADGSHFWGHLQTTQPHNGEQWIALTDVSELRKSENDLRESNAYLDSLFDYANAPIIVWDNNLRITRFNKAFEVITGRSSADVIGCDISILFPVDQIGDSISIIKNAVFNRLETVEIPIFHVNGTISYLLWNSASILGKDGTTALATIAQGHNITKRKQVEKEIRSSEEHFRAIFDLSTVGKSLTAPDGKLLKVNRAFAEMVGYSIDEMQQLGFEQITHPDDVAESFKCIRDLLSGKRSSLRFEKRYIHKNGAIVWADVSTVVLRDEQGAPLHLITNILDITERKRTEEVITQAKNDWERTFDAVPDLIAIIDTNHTITRANKAMAERCGHTPEEMIGRKCHEVMHGMPDPPIFCPHVSMMQDGLMHSKEIDENRLNGSFEISVSPLYNSKRQITACVHFARDITDRKRSEENRHNLEQQLLQSQKMEAIGQLAGGVAHDFNNILTAIIGFSTLIDMHLNADDQNKDHLHQVIESAYKAAELTKGLLAFSRKQVINPKPVDLNQIIRKTEKFMKRIIPEDIEFKVSLNNDALIINADSGQIDQIIMNLVTNARDAMPNGGLLLIETHALVLNDDFIKAHGFGEPGHYSVMAFSDNGMGMSPETSKKLFEPFFTTKELGKGTGLGLSIVYGIIKQHNGFINVYSEPGKGTTFRIYLPLIECTTVNDLDNMNSEAVRGGSETILVADDDLTVRELLEITLKQFGYTVITATDGIDAVAKFTEKQTSINLILLDVLMPKMNGKEVYDQIKKIDPAAKLIFMSGHTSDVIHKHGLLDESIRFLAKPLNPRQLLAMVRKVLDGDANEE